MFSRRTIVSAVEFGSSKIAVWVGEVGDDDRVTLIGRGQASSAGAVVKGEILDMAKAGKGLEQAVREADISSGGELGNARVMLLLVTGCGIESQSGAGTSFVKNEEHVVTELERDEAIDNAKVISLSADRELINCSTTSFLVDGRRVSNPLNQKGRKVETRAHVVHGISSRLDNFRSLVRDCGMEDVRLEIIYSPLASHFGILTDSERDEGVLLVDLGAGCADYLVAYDSGICASGTLQVGMEHVANDLAIGLDLHIDICRRLLETGAVERAKKENVPYLEFRSAPGKVRKIPLSGFEQIIDLRLREIFDIIRRKLAERGVPWTLGAGGVLTGGGALTARAPELFSEVFELPCRIGSVADASGAVTGVENPRFSAIWGALKVAGFYERLYVPESNAAVGGLINRLAGAWVSAGKSLGRIKEAIRF